MDEGGWNLFEIVWDVVEFFWKMIWGALRGIVQGVLWAFGKYPKTAAAITLLLGFGIYLLCARAGAPPR